MKSEQEIREKMIEMSGNHELTLLLQWVLGDDEPLNENSILLDNGKTLELGIICKGGESGE